MDINSISDAIPSNSAMIVLGTGALAARAIMAAGQLDTSVVTVDPKTGAPGLSTTPQQIMTPADPEANMAIKTPDNSLAMQGIQTPQMSMKR